MALNGDRLGDAIKAAVDAVGDKTDRVELFRAIGNAIVAEITTNAAVNVISVSGVTAGAAASGPGTGTVS